MHRGIILFCILLTLGACAGGSGGSNAVYPAVARQGDALPWTAAIGILVAGRLQCTASLVAPDIVASAYHCVTQQGKATDVKDMAFVANYGEKDELSPVYAQSILGRGQRGNYGWYSQVVSDWILIKLKSPIQGITPFKLANISLDQVREKLDNGAEFFSAGYGVGNGDKLFRHKGCNIHRDSEIPSDLREAIIVTSCHTWYGDSGGPIAMVEKDGSVTLLGVITGGGDIRGRATTYGPFATSFQY